MSEKSSRSRDRGQDFCRRFGPAIMLLVGLGTVQAGEETKQAAAAQSLPDSRLGMRTAPLLLLSRLDVQRDLEMSTAQISSARRAIEELHAKATNLKGKTGPEVRAARRAIDEAQSLWIDRELSRDQHARLDQIELQWEGPSAIVSRKAIADVIELNLKQREIILHAVTVRDRRRAQGQEIATVEEDLAREVLQILNDNQKARWRSLMGRPFRPFLSKNSGR